MQRTLIRIIGSLNLLFSLAGLGYFGVRLANTWSRWPVVPSASQWAAFWLLSLLTVVIVGNVGFLGIRLIRGDQSAIRTTLYFFSAEIFFFVVEVGLFWIISPNPRLTVGFLELSSAALDPQIVTGYPLLGVIALFLVKPKISSSER